jgi:predicted anti-sigma-YlaC factor YlaD
MAENGTRPPDTADKQLGEIVSDVTSKAQLLVREEIELAKAEVSQKVSRITKGIVGFAVAAFFALLMVIFALDTLAWGLIDAGLNHWVGFGATALLLLLLTIVSALVGLRLVKKGSPPTPELAIEEAQKTKAALQEARS